MKKFFAERRWARVTGWILLVLALITLAVSLFINLWPPFSARISRPDRNVYYSRAVNYEGNRFFNQGTLTMVTDAEDPYASRSTGKGETPEGELPAVTPSPLAEPGEGDLTVTWLGHSTTLIQMSGMNILIDPVLTDLVSPVSFTGSRRYSPLPVTAEDLPHIDLVLISHDHYDHLDMGTIQAIDGKVDRYIVPFGIENDLRRWGVDNEKLTALGWWEDATVGSLTVACAPARHYSGRNITDKNRTLWASWALMNGTYKVYESGDSGTGPHFEEIHNRWGDFDLALMDCAQYNTRWHDVHMFPEEAVDAALALGAKAAMPIHWGAFVLSDHAWDDPPERFTQYAEEQGLEVLTPRLGETFNWDDRAEREVRWWREIR